MFFLKLMGRLSRGRVKKLENQGLTKPTLLLTSTLSHAIVCEYTLINVRVSRTIYSALLLLTGELLMAKFKLWTIFLVSLSYFTGCPNSCFARIIYLDDFFGSFAAVTAVKSNLNASVVQSGLDPRHTYFPRRIIGSGFNDVGVATATLSGAPDNSFSFHVGPGSGRVPVSTAYVGWTGELGVPLNFSFTSEELANPIFVEIDFESLNIYGESLNVRLATFHGGLSGYVGYALSNANLTSDIDSPTTLRFPGIEPDVNDIDKFELQFQNIGTQIASGTISAIRIVTVPETSSLLGVCCFAVFACSVREIHHSA